MKYPMVPRVADCGAPEPSSVELLAAFDRSGLPAAAFARQQGLNYTTFAAGATAGPSSGFVQVELPSPATPAELMIELSAHARVHISCASQIQLVARLLQALNTMTSC